MKNAYFPIYLANYFYFDKALTAFTSSSLGRILGSGPTGVIAYVLSVQTFLFKHMIRLTNWLIWPWLLV